MTWLRLLLMVAMLSAPCALFNVYAQKITIGGNVYGGGNAGNTGGSTKVTVHAGNLEDVYGGARMADVKGSTFVHIDGEHASDDILITTVYGGNDIAGKIGDSNVTTTVPTELDNFKDANSTNVITNDWKTFVRTSPIASGKLLVIGSLFGGGNGDYTYSSTTTGEGTEAVTTYSITNGSTVVATSGSAFNKPELSTTYLELKGGCIAHVYGGGNNVTVTENTTINIDNENADLLAAATAWASAHSGQTVPQVLASLQTKVNLSVAQSDMSSYAFHFARVFGGNNKAPMNIRPIWNLQNGTIRDLYSGGNQGAMTYSKGIFLPIASEGMTIENVFGGCRRADVSPAGVLGIEEETFSVAGTDYTFPEGYAARLLITAGNIDYVYGGNDISGTVKFGNAIGIRSSINKDVYGGGNGSYIYTNLSSLANDEDYKDFYYTVPDGKTPAEALNDFRPNAESVSIHIEGKSATDQAIIGGAVYCGGNSATLNISEEDESKKAELKLGKYVIADKVFLGCNGENMIKPTVLADYVDTSKGNLNLKDPTTFATYMKGVDMGIMPTVAFDADVDYNTYIGSYFCGGNVGSMSAGGTFDLNFNNKIIIYNKLVGGCNNADVEAGTNNAAYLGGLLTATTDGSPKLKINLAGPKMEPKRWNSTYTPLDNDENLVVGNKYYTSALGDGEFIAESTVKEAGKTYYKMTSQGTALIWNTVSAASGLRVNPSDLETGIADKDRRLFGGNVYGGCYSSGHVNGDVVININGSLVDCDKVFDVVTTTKPDGTSWPTGYEPKFYDEKNYNITTRNSGVIFDEQGVDVFGSALNVFGGGYGASSEIWGSATINLNKGYAFQIFGGGEAGAIGHEKDSNGKYIADEKYSTYIHLNDKDNIAGTANAEGIAEATYIYGGGFEGTIAGSTHVYLDNGRIFNSFAGSCNADILGHTETYVGQTGYPWIRDHIYGGNDLGGSILGIGNFMANIRNEVKDMVNDASRRQVEKVASYMEYTQGRVEHIFGGSFGTYTYNKEPYLSRVKKDDEGNMNKPYLHNAFVNIRPNKNVNNEITKVFGAGEGYTGDRDGDKLQDHSYVLIDIPDNVENFANTEIFGAGAYDGLGMRYTVDETFDNDFDLNEASAIIDLMRGKVSAAYGGSYQEGVTRRTMVNVPDQSSINIKNIFGGAYGIQILPPCDVYESNVNYLNTSEKACVTGAIYGGNNNERRTLYAKVNISSAVLNPSHWSGLATVYGAGRGVDTWSEYTEVNLARGAKIFEVYGGGEMGHVLNAESVQKYMQLYTGQPSAQISEDDPKWKKNDYWILDGEGKKVSLKSGKLNENDEKTIPQLWADDWKSAWTFGDYYRPNEDYSNYTTNTNTNLSNVKTDSRKNGVVKEADIDDRANIASNSPFYKKYNTNVLIQEGATVMNYAYGGGYGDVGKPLSGDVYGSTYIALLGGTVNKDIYAAGTAGAVYDLFGAKNFTATANAYVKGGTVRNVYGGGWRGSVGYNANYTSTNGDILGESHVVIGKREGGTPLDGVPAVRRSIYGGGEGGGIFGTAFVTINNGYIGYHYDSNNKPVSELDDPAPEDDRIDKSGNVYGGGYVANSYVDISDIKMYGGQVSGSLYGGGEVGPIGRGTVKAGAVSGIFTNDVANIYKPGETHINMYKGKVLRNVFGGGRGKDSWDGEGYMTAAERATMDLSSKGYVFGKTDVNIHGGVIGSPDGLTKNYGNVFGGGDLGFVYSATGTKSTADGYYHDGNDNLTEDCRVSVKVLGYAKEGVRINGTDYAAGDVISNEVLNTLSNSDIDIWSKIDQEGITIHNGVFAGGNVSSGASEVLAYSTTVFGNATAAVVDVFCRDLISVGGDGVGGIYGDGNLTYVDGYRELNISNYGTDFYALPSSMDLTDPAVAAEYNKLTDRQKDIYVVKYKFDGSAEGNVNGLYEAGDVILSEEYNKLTDTQKPHWTAIHSVINEGRYINTIQRCDFCGIIGSRLVLRGAMDRAQDSDLDNADFTNYTINRVGELSLNQWHSLGEGVSGDVIHGCYFGIYNVVKLLGAVTSDVRFDDIRETGSTIETNLANGTTTYWQWKQDKKKDNNVNNGSSWNKIALASGVFLEIVKSVEDNGTKEYGPITGIIELDLLNVTPGEGGGYVYAKNIHGDRSTDEDKETAAVLSEANRAQGGCRTNAGYSYSTPDIDHDLETSGNFVSSLKDIVDDCFPVSKSWMGSSAAPAHYWYIRGEFYVYDQEVSAYTGSADAYSAEISIPLTMVAQSNAKLRILNILPGLYADPTQFDPNKSSFDADLNTWKSDSLEIAYDNVTKRFGQNDPISYWDWYMTSKANQSRFVTETYCCNEQVTVNGVTYYPGQGILPATYNSLKNVSGTDAYGAPVANAQEKFSKTNGVSKDNGYVLTLDMTNPSKWNDYYTALNNNTVKLSKYQWSKLTDEEKKAYVESATFRCNASGTYGQYFFTEGDIISQAVYEMQTSDVTNHASSTQASFVRAYVAKDSCEVTIGGEPRIIQKNAQISQTVYNTLSNTDKAHFDLGKVCGSTFNVSDKELYVLGQVVPSSSTIASGAYAENFTDAWYCTGEGSWGGQYYEKDQNYNGVYYCQLLPEEHSNFSYNYDALDLLIADYQQKNGNSYPTKEELARAGTELNQKVILYDGTNTEKLYSTSVHIDYDATYKGSSTFTYKADDGTKTEITVGTKLESADYQNLPNDFAHYASIHVNDNHKITDESDPDKGNYVVYVVWNTFDVGGMMYNAGKVITKADYDGLGSLQSNVDKVVMTPAQQQSSSNGVFYYCIDKYTVGEKDKYVDEYHSPQLIDIDNDSYNFGDEIEVGTIISHTNMVSTNYQMDFEVSGEIPQEQTTLYVPVTADYNELQKDRYITVIFEYTYTESDAQGLNFETRVEKHILNLRIKFKSGKPIIGKLKEPDYVLPLETVTLGLPFIQESANAFPILKGGFEIYDNETDALKHRNGRDFSSGTEPVYFYEDMNYVAYYAETRMGRTYSDPVPIHVANYQRMSDVINDSEHMYINHRLVKRNPKIYIDDRSVSGKDYNELDAMKELFDIVNGAYGQVAANNTEKNHGRDVTGAKGLDFFVQNDVAATRSWTSIGTDDDCFEGNFHGNGHTLSNMSSSLFGKLCGNVYNIGVMGSFTGGGIADSGDGRIENTWVSTTGTPTGKAIIKTTDGIPTLINGYYPETQGFTPHEAGVDVMQRSLSDFQNGRVAYDLNRFYLEARYNLFTDDENVNGNPVHNYAHYRMPDGTLQQETVLLEGGGEEVRSVSHQLYYTPDYTWHTGIGAANTSKKYGYVESLYEDGDFRFADGLKPTSPDLRLSQNYGYVPVFPDDYIFFGQRLTYGLYGDKSHDAVPMGVVKDHTVTTATDVIDNSKSGLLTDDLTSENRVYRAPAYFRNGTLGETAMFNANAAFADTYNGTDAYKNMTAIDFTGSNGDTHGMQGVVPGAKSDFTNKTNGYGPRLDFLRLDNFRTSGLTRNLLAYAPDPTVANTMNTQTAETLKEWASELTYAEDETNPHYRTVAVQDDSEVNGHMVQKSDDGFKSVTDHFLVDKQNFNAPIAYTMGDGKRMWYQREPDNWIDKDLDENRDKGWEAVSLPFSAEIVTTQDKGEITHFFKGSETGHEYWLREYKGGNMQNDNTTFLAKMYKLDVGTEDKTYTNTFLWDYYYSKDSRQDKNLDKYQMYYNDSHTYKNYPYLTNGTAYIIGFPGAYYYEFDLSGNWTPKNRYEDGIIDSPGLQTITFASKPGAAIDVSDTEVARNKSTDNGYTFLPNYLDFEIDANMGYLLNGEGSSFIKNSTAVTTVPFRPYFVAASTGARTRGAAEQIIFGRDDSMIDGDEVSHTGQDLFITTRQHKIIVESQLRYVTDVRIVNTAGITMKTFTIKPGEVVETTMINAGVYIVQTSDARYTKKLAVK